ncbi:MAG: HEAT repeat domain-containing protein [Vicinamibacteria bacterium]|nr:HEAT repeat domain-containing protein [Vicinamibacteria bacterium]
MLRHVHARRARLPLAAAVLILVASAAEADRGERLARLSDAEHQRNVGAVASALADPDRGVRRRAALAAATLGDPQLWPAIQSLLDDPEPAVRAAAAFASGLIRDGAARPRLEARLADPDVEVRARAAEALGRLTPGTTASRLAQHLDTLLPPGPRVTVRDEPAAQSDPWLEARLTLLALGAQRDPAVALRSLSPPTGPRIDWWPAAWVASRFESPAMLPVLESAAASSSVPSRALAAASLGRHPAGLAALRRLLADPEPAVVSAALRGLAEHRTQAAAEAALPLMRSARPEHRAGALGVLAAGPALPELAARVLPALADEDPEVRARAHEALARLEPEAYPLLLSGLDSEPSSLVREAMARTIRAIGGPLAAARLPEFAADPDPAVRAAAGPQAPEPSSARRQQPRRPLADHLAATAPYQLHLSGQIYSPRVVLETTAGRIELLLDPVHAPLAVADFVALARRGAYDGTPLRHLLAEVEVSAGPALAAAAIDPLPAERTLRPTGRGTALASGPAGGFALSLVAQPERDGSATVLGAVTVGLDVVRRLRPHDQIRAVVVWDGR